MQENMTFRVTMLRTGGASLTFDERAPGSVCPLFWSTAQRSHG